jgi:reverse gyrase
MKKTKKTIKRRKINIRINPEKSPYNHNIKKLESSPNLIKKDVVKENLEEKPIGFVERINQLSQQVQMLVDEEEHNEIQYQLLKMMYNDDVNLEYALNTLDLSEDELMYLVDELVELGFLKYISDNETEITEEGISYLKWRELNFES